MPYSLYFHIPFCAHRCAYCDFNTYAGQDALIPVYVNTLRNEIRFVANGAERSSEPQATSAVEVHTIFFGGGTPSLLTPLQFESILKEISTRFKLLPDAEVTLEANPGTVSLDDLHGLRRAGFNRISFGAQSANPNELRMLERAHTFVDVINAVGWARRAGFDRQSNGVNLDLIYGLPEQTLPRWQDTVKRVLALRPEHLSLYALTLEHGTPFGRWASHGLLPIPDPDLAAEMYEWSSEFLAANGYVQYEISNWGLDRRPLTADRESDYLGELRSTAASPQGVHRAVPAGGPPSFACKHNLQYWRNLDYLGFGAGAHGYAAGVRYSNVLRIKTYLERFSQSTNSQSTHMPFPLTPAIVNHHKNTPRDDMQETMMTGLRLTREGISAGIFRERFGVELRDVFGKEIDELLGLKLLEWSEDCLRLTERGRLLGNQVFMRFVGE